MDDYDSPWKDALERDRYRRPVVSLAVLADEQTDWRPERFG